MKVWQRVWVTLLVINILAVAAFWWKGSSASVLSGNVGQLLVAFGRLAGLAASLAVLLQFLAMSRLPWLERAFGLDKLSVFHQLNGKIALPLLLLHPAFVVFGYSNMMDVSFRNQMFTLVQGDSTMVMAMVGLVLFVLVATTSLYFVWRKFSYESWYFVHLLAYAAVFFSFWHQIKLGTDLIVNQAFYFYWISLYIAVLVSVLVFRFLRPLFFLKKHGFEIDRLVQETDMATSIYIKGRQLEKLSAQAGQFVFLRFLQKGFWLESHPFSLSAVPRGEELRVTIKAVGDFTSNIPKLESGTKVIIDGPHGIFTSNRSRLPKVLLIAGGIGITPLRSIFEEMLDQEKDVVLLYGNRKLSDIVFREEINSLSEKHNARVVHILSEEKDGGFESGYIDKEKLSKLVPDITEREVYLCGPAPMMKLLQQSLVELGVKKENIYFEVFSLH